MKLATKSFLLFFALLTGAASAETKWETDLSMAFKQAAAEKKAVLVDFTGSDWCVWCKKLSREVFNEPAFREFAQKNLILVEVDFPRYKAQPEDQRKNNEALSNQYGVDGFPTVLIFDASGRELAKTGYRDGGAQSYVDYLASIPGFQWQKVVPEKKTPNDSKSKTTLAPPAEIRYDEIALRGISGKSLKTALINNQTFSAGSSGRVKLADKHILIECKEIRDDSVLIQVEGEAQPRELKLKSAQKK